MMNIQICPIKRLYQIVDSNSSNKCAAIISSAAGIDGAKLRGICYVFRQYDDLDYECPGRSFSQADAAAFADFVRELEQGIHTLYCCCDAGESRSPAVAAAVMRYLGMDDMPVWRDPHYHPNMLVFSMLAEALDVTASDEEKDFRLAINRQAFRNAIRR